MASETWKEVLKSQHADLEKLEAMDAALNENAIADDIDRILRRPNAASSARHTSISNVSDVPSPPKPSIRRSSIGETQRSTNGTAHEMYIDSNMGSSSGHDVQSVENPLSARGSPPHSAEAPLAPETADR